MKATGDSRAINRTETAKLHRRLERDRLRTEDESCDCGWITALIVCPWCGGDRADRFADDGGRVFE